jgi:hypothetical protein
MLRVRDGHADGLSLGAWPNFEKKKRAIGY